MKQFRTPFVRTRWLGLILCLPSLCIAAENVITCQPSQDTPIEYGDIVNCSIEVVGDSDVFEFSGSLGETILVQAPRRTGAGNPLVDLFRPDGTRIGGGLNPFNVTLDQTGPYTAVVREFQNNATVQYTLTVERVSSPSLTARETQYGKTLNDSVNPPGDIDVFFFQATEGDTVAISAPRRTGAGNPLVDLFSPDGTRVGGGLNPFNVTLDQTGLYTVLVREFQSNATVDYSLTVQCTDGECAVVPIPDVEGCIDLKGSPLQGRRVELRQPSETTRITTTDVRGCYKFVGIKTGKSFTVVIVGPTVN
jgi:hypothetical protein